MERLVEVTRGPLVESAHRGSIAVADASGRLLAWAGDPDMITYYRSSAKPIQALPVLTSGAAAKFGLSEQELAVICASHSGEEEHVQAVSGILAKLGLSQDYLLCGVHPPFHKLSAQQIWRQGEEPGAVHCNCSGKHSGMLALCRYYGWPLDNYLDLSHPLQQMLLETIKSYHETEDVAVGVDGCGVPVYGMSLIDMAKGYARLVDPDGKFLPVPLAEASKQVVKAMTKYPKLVAGTGRFDTILMEETGGKVVAKTGAEGVECFGLVGRGIGVAIKIEDGNNRAAEPAAIEVLRQVKLLSEAELQALAHIHKVAVKNHRRETVGEIKPVFRLNFDYR
ncbi:MAG: asparaginase [Firmicutes bacterium]|nr:asparaginase [Bacillota bacterium]